jgi:hypothetical protein
MLFGAAITKHSLCWLSPGSISTSCYHQILNSPKTPTIIPKDTKTARHSKTPISTMSQNTAKQMLLKCLAQAQKEHESPHSVDHTTTSNDCIDPRLLAISNNAAVPEEDVHAPNSTASATDSAVSKGNYLGSPSDDSALSESG